jgi:hypothetical protein
MKIHYLANETCVKTACQVREERDGFCAAHYRHDLDRRIREGRREVKDTVRVIARLILSRRLSWN